MLDQEILEDSTIKRIIVGSFAGLTLGMLLAIVLVVIHDPVFTPVVFLGVIAFFIFVLWRWSDRLDHKSDAHRGSAPRKS